MDTVQRGPTAVTPLPHHGPMRVADQELADEMARLEADDRTEEAWVLLDAWWQA